MEGIPKTNAQKYFFAAIFGTPQIPIQFPTKLGVSIKKQLQGLPDEFLTVPDSPYMYQKCAENGIATIVWYKFWTHSFLAR